MSDLWHKIVHRTGWVKAGTFLSVFIVLYAIAISAFFNVASNTDPEASFKQPKLSSAQTSADFPTFPPPPTSLNAVTFAYSFTPSDKFIGWDASDADSALKLNHNVKFTFGTLAIPQYDFGTESYVTQTRFPNTLTAEGSYAFYPTDVYKFKGISVSCKFAAQPEDAEAITAVSKSSPSCPFALNIRSGIKTNFHMEITDVTGSTVKNAADGLTYDLTIEISRPFMFRLYPGFVIFAFWLIILIELSLIFALSFFDFRKVEFGSVALFSGLIFALPSFRNSMPLAPPFGSLSDWISFFWAEGFAVLGLCILGTKYLSEAPASKSNGKQWLMDVFCAPIPPKPAAVAPSTQAGPQGP